MNEEKAILLIDKYKKGELTAAEEQRLNEWYLIRAAESKHELSLEQMEELVELIRSNLPLTTPKTLPLWRRFTSIAAAVVFVAFGIYFFNYRSESPGNQERPFEHAPVSDIQPGKVGATLTLTNGEKIRLSAAAAGKIANEAGITITKTADGQIIYHAAPSTASVAKPNAMNTLSTAKGETYILVLPDRSKVWMNAASSISYAVNLADHAIRRVKIEGEAYFEVAKDKARPFIVESKGQRIEVLGTHFNVNSYANEPVTATTLLEGLVKVTAGKHTKIIRPGEQALTTGDKISVATANMDKVIDWKDGDFYLNHMNFKTAMRKIARWYDIEVIYDPAFPDDMESGGWISRNNKLSAVLKLIESSGQVHFKIEGKKVYVSK